MLKRKYRNLKFYLNGDKYTLKVSGDYANFDTVMSTLMEVENACAQCKAPAVLQGMKSVLEFDAWLLTFTNIEELLDMSQLSADDTYEMAFNQKLYKKIRNYLNRKHYDEFFKVRWQINEVIETYEKRFENTNSITKFADKIFNEAKQGEDIIAKVDADELRNVLNNLSTMKEEDIVKAVIKERTEQEKDKKE